jgi:glycine cleavage system transcriptional repressor
MSRFSVMMFGPDRPGIVAAVARVLADVGCNLEESSVAILQGHAALMLVVSGPPGMSAAALDGLVAPVVRELDLQASVREIAANLDAEITLYPEIA